GRRAGRARQDPATRCRDRTPGTRWTTRGHEAVRTPPRRVRPHERPARNPPSVTAPPFSGTIVSGGVACVTRRGGRDAPGCGGAGRGSTHGHGDGARSDGCGRTGGG